jgi:hypothetical protein
MSSKIALSSLAMDLKRVALGYHRGSRALANRFFEEALKRRNEIDMVKIKPYVKNILDKIETIRSEKEEQRKAEDALLYSILLQNAAIISV